MATRGDIKDAFYSELVTVADTYDVTDANGNVVDSVTLDADHIALTDPEEDESTPYVVYNDDYRQVVYNDVGTAPDYTEYNQDGSVKHEEWREYVEAQFIVDVQASTEPRKEPIYEAIHSVFQKYQFEPWDEKDFHSDVLDIEVRDTRSTDRGDVNEVVRADQVEVYVTFHRAYILDVDNITQVNQDVDGVSFTTN